MRKRERESSAAAPYTRSLAVAHSLAQPHAQAYRDRLNERGCGTCKYTRRNVRRTHMLSSRYRDDREEVEEGGRREARRGRRKRRRGRIAGEMQGLCSHISTCTPSSPVSCLSVCGMHTRVSVHTSVYHSGTGGRYREKIDRETESGKKDDQEGMGDSACVRVCACACL